MRPRFVKMRIDPARVFAAAALSVTWLILFGCDEEENETNVTSGQSKPSQTDLWQGQQIAGAAAGESPSDNDQSTPGSGDLRELGGNADQNQDNFRRRFGLTTPSPEQLAAWNAYDARLTAYSNRDPDWPSPTAASSNWMDSTWTNGDPLAIEGTTVAVDFNRIPRGSLIYIPSLNMYAEANDTGATGLWSQSDAGRSDYGPDGAGRVDVYNLAGSRTPNQVEHDFENTVGSSEYGKVYVVHAGPGWKR
jgi:3D (Asp-Asp-Asp) domain-containing protein